MSRIKNHKKKQLKDCPECLGIGEISSDNCTYCGGAGKVIIHSHEHSHGNVTHDHPHPHDHAHHPDDNIEHTHVHQEDNRTSASRKKVSIDEKENLCSKIIELYPNIGQCGIDVEVDFDEAFKKWVVYLKEGNRIKKTYLEDGDAELCMQGRQCVSLGIEIAQFV